MIFYIYFTLLLAGVAASNILMGNYMMYYAGARESDLGFLFMIQPASIFLRPFICAQADRNQSHKQLLSMYLMLISISYTPFIVLPFMCGPSRFAIDNSTDTTQQLKYWFLVVCQIFGSIGICGTRSLGDALAVNYAKRIGSEFVRYRKYGSMSYGISGLALGAINQGWLLPDFTPHIIMYSLSTFILAILIYAWPNEYFEMASSDTNDEQAQREYRASLPGLSATLRHMSRRLGDALSCRWCVGGEHKQIYNDTVRSQQKIDANLATGQTHGHHLVVADEKNDPSAKRVLSVKQQLGILSLLLKRDFRVSLYLLAIFYGGFVGYSGRGFVFTYINVTCHTKGTCDSAQLSGLVMFSYCIVETLCYILVDKFRGRLNRVLIIELTFLSLAIHYYFYGFALDHLSPYFFLMEALHGLECSLNLATSVELGYHFAGEVQVLLPELIQKGVISKNDNEELVKVSLMATMNGCYTFVYDGLGCILGSLIFGLILGYYSFIVTWISIGTLAVVGFVSILFIYSLGKCFNIRPEILRIRDRQIASSNLGDSATGYQ